MDWTQVFTIISVFVALIYWMKQDMKDGFTRLEVKIDKLEGVVTDIDRRLCRLEGAFSSKDCCMIKDSSQLKKVE